MKHYMLWSKIGLGALMIAVTGGCVGQITGGVNSQSHVSSPGTGQVSSAAGQRKELAEKASSITVHIDPKTGELTTPPSKALSVQIPQRSLETAREPPLPELQQTLSPVPGGGVMIHLDERFFTPLTAAVDADGKVVIRHQPATPIADEKK